MMRLSETDRTIVVLPMQAIAINAENSSTSRNPRFQYNNQLQDAIS